ncbi:uncharacterized protein [Zea mays]|uniref:uncharacterized protein n=1 Tax=Zea mays TaxID=4577 RepID=UPI0009A98B57|nr:uncharacterized protein LOC103644016 [Zea mays]|eukprot:XP_020402530.1 uncharacterized protein LOC103644016 [Zea mays]
MNPACAYTEIGNSGDPVAAADLLLLIACSLSPFAYVCTRRCYPSLTCSSSFQICCRDLIQPCCGSGSEFAPALIEFHYYMCHLKLLCSNNMVKTSVYWDLFFILQMIFLKEIDMSRYACFI